MTTWEGARRAQLRHALRLTLRERLQVLDDMNEVAEHFRHMRETDMEGARQLKKLAGDQDRGE
ncbi:MAG: hypothetical protein A3G81_19795 [Betaproteobacteria bacterium RIFCSPLOWO2_12_FULL_65_14]|nr:MAG: hypothetical protein A3G81_19795 [Betaproteobacteria bacterium RIFCSPLOWO2_12_FULL_65_14]